FPPHFGLRGIGMTLSRSIVQVCCAFILAGLMGCGRSAEDDYEQALNRVDAIVRWSGGWVEYDEADPEQPLVVVNLARSQVLNATLRHIGKVTSLRTLILTDCQRIDDEGVALLTDLSNLQTLDLSGTWITDSCFENLAALRSLHTLKVNNNEKLFGYGL